MKSVVLTLLVFMGTQATAEVYKIDPAASKVEWLAGKKIGSSHNGEVKVKSGEVQTDKKGKISTAKIVVDMKTISNMDLQSDPGNQKKLVGHLASDDFFKVDKFPESTFNITSITPKEGAKDEYMVKGELTMLGKSGPVEFPAKITADKGTLTGTAKVTIDRLKWNLQYGSGSIFKKLTADKIINDTFDLTLNLVAKK